MKLSLFLATVVLVAAVAAEEEMYSDKYDYVDAAGILANERLREQYYSCFIGSAPCATPDAKFFKGIYTYDTVLQ